MRHCFHAILVIASLGIAAPAAWAIEPADPLPASHDATPPAADAVAAATDPLFATPVAGSLLDDLRGGTDNETIITNVSDVQGTVDGNVAMDTLSGSNLVDGGAFGNAAGLSTVIQNSGNNVLIQNSTVVSVLFAPSP